jgi:hypothetical protein
MRMAPDDVKSRANLPTPGCLDAVRRVVDGRRKAVVARGWNDPDNARWEEAHRTFRMEPEKWLLDSSLLDLKTGELVNVTAVDRVSHYNSGLFFLPDGRGLGFTALINNISKPFVMDLDGRNKRDVSGKDGGFAYGYSASPDGKQISYHEDYQFFLAEPTGRRRNGSRPAMRSILARNGRLMGNGCYSSVAFVDAAIPYIVRRDGTGLRKLAT